MKLKKEPPSTKRRKRAKRTGPVRNGDGLLFRRTTKPVKSIVVVADVWREMFLDFCMTLTGTEEWADKPPASLVYHARTLADAALDEYQNRWPGVEPPQQ